MTNTLFLSSNAGSKIVHQSYLTTRLFNNILDNDLLSQVSLKIQTKSYISLIGSFATYIIQL